MAYVGRAYFEKNTGNLVHWYEMEGDIIPPSIEQDLSSTESLAKYTVEDLIVVELEQSDHETREKFRKARSIRFDPVTKQVVFDLDAEVQIP